MTNQEDNLICMLYDFKEYEANYTAITNLLPNHTSELAVLNSTINQIAIVSEQQKLSKKGLIDVKNSLRENLIITTVDTARKLGVFALFTKNMTLAQEVKITNSMLKNSSAPAVKNYAQIVYDKAQSNIAALSVYGITAATQTAFLALITSFTASIGKPGAGRTEKKKTTKQLKDLIKSAKASLKILDASVEIVRLSQPAFYAGYKNARKIIDRGGSKLSVQGTVIDDSSEEPVTNAELTFVNSNPNGLMKMSAETATEKYVKKSAQKGKFNIKSLPAGVYTVTIKKPGYADYVTTLVIADGELSKLHVKLTRNA